MNGKPLAWQHPFSAPIGIKVLVPGLLQWTWGQRERGMVFAGSFLASLGTSLFCWGNPLGWGFLGFAFLTHTVSSWDVLRQRSFPVFPRIVALLATMGGLGSSVYIPLVAMLSLAAWPACSDRSLGMGYLVNCLAYETREPSPGQWIWLRSSSGSPSQAGRVVAVAGQEVEWTGRSWRVDGKELQVVLPRLFPSSPEAWRFRIPEHHVLIDPAADLRSAERAAPLVMVSRDQIVGRAWARYDPFWDRCLL